MMSGTVTSWSGAFLVPQLEGCFCTAWGLGPRLTLEGTHSPSRQSSLPCKVTLPQRPLLCIFNLGWRSL